jgi:Acetyl co-enzyme A carboxylase carboxyltransferase alpha subunit
MHQQCMHQQCALPVAGLDDPAMVAGIGSIDGVSYMMIGQQKGRNTKVLFVTDMPVWRWLHSMVRVEPACIMPGCAGTCWTTPADMHR